MKRIKTLLLIAVFILAIGGYFFYKNIKASATFFNGEYKIVELHEMTIPELAQQLQADSIVTSSASFATIAQVKGLSSFEGGRFKFDQGTSLSAIVNKIKSGNQFPKRVRLEGVRSIQQLCGLLGQELESDSVSFINAFLEPQLLDSLNLDSTEVSSLVFPNTYEFYWTISPEAFVKKMIALHDEYWTDEKLTRIKSLGLTPAEIYTMASIVKGETVDKSEAATIAGVYLNRLRIGMKLQADPTLTFEKYTGRMDRITLNNASKTSKYNTYVNAGLPPGPIFFTEPFFLDAVIKNEKHNYLYFCAVPGGGKHAFTHSPDQHYKNAAAYHRWLNNRN